jgi:hypothetical protein
MGAPRLARRAGSRVRSLDGARVLIVFVALLALASACGDSGGMQIQIASDAASDADAAPGDASAGDVADAPSRADTEAPQDGADAPGADGGGGRPTGDGGDAAVPAARPPATASWTLAPNPMCVAAGAGCMDLGAVGDYQITASGSCPTASDIQLWFPGGVAPLAVGTYAVKAASGILDVIAMPAGMVGLLVERDDASGAHHEAWGRAGTVAVAAAGATLRHVTFSGVSVRDTPTAVTATLGGDVSCP